MTAYPQLPVGGRLKFFIKEWEKITDDKWVLSTIANGLKLDFLSKPKWEGVKQTYVDAKHLPIILSEVESLLEKGAIEPVPPSQIKSGFYSTFFLVPKKTGDLRPIINLRPLNRYIVKKHFRMDTLTKVLNLVKPNDWAISLDLKDAYLHIPIHRSHRKYLRFCIQGKVYQFVALCFGPTQAPRCFTKVVSVVTAYLRMQNVRLASYLDDWLVVNAIRKALLLDREKLLSLLHKLGFIINWEKSALIPSQTVTYIGALFNFRTGMVLPTPERVQKLFSAVHKLMNNPSSARDFLHTLGLMASCIELVPNARLYMRPIQLHLLHFWKPITNDLEMIVPVTQHLKQHLHWWLNQANITKGRSLAQWSNSVTITTDASKIGFGGHMNNQLYQGIWTKTEAQQHINMLELEAVCRTVAYFLPALQNRNVLLRSDNTTVVQYINKQGGTKSVSLCYKVWELFKMTLQHAIHIKAAHLSGHHNFLADRLSRPIVRPTEWTLNNQVLNKLFYLWGKPMIDLFASEDNNKMQIFCTWFPSHKAYAIDALSIPWNNMEAYAFPPICLVPKVLEHMSQYNCQLLLIAPQWPRRHWYTNLLQKLIDYPRRLPIKSNLLQQPKTMIYHPAPEIFNLTAWLLSTETSKIKAFQKKLENCSQLLGEQEHNKTMLANSKNSIAGVVNNKKIPILPL